MKPRKIELSLSQKQLMISRIQHYYSTEMGEEIGNLGATLLLDFIVEKLAPIFYNLGMDDCITIMMQHVEDLHGQKF
ncbi:MAG: DUF2164 domain-containing protein [Candidatus Cloacimonetes bacterium]|nr:DUF2164 domain-containing protein [Candidatus Cloacimonadota bacterium]